MFFFDSNNFTTSRLFFPTAKHNPVLLKISKRNFIQKNNKVNIIQ